MQIIKTNKNSLLVQLTERQLNIISANLELQIYDLEDANNDLDKKAIKNDCVDILSELQNVGIWGQLPTLKK
jgi:hypothetical protein|tara:strand:+ start:175 stop:390 length:216 start_codon:yes stop_codon:yes gene_type:complete